MDFFERQDIARKKTGRLIVLFAIAVVMIVCAMNLAVFGIAVVAKSYDQASNDHVGFSPAKRNAVQMLIHGRDFTGPPIFIGTTLITLGIITCGSLYKMAMLSRGGPAVAQLMGARPIRTGLSALDEEKTLQNVVEEMAIASGVPVPQIFVMEDEDAINAFAAGFTPSDAVVAVTRGCLTRLTRDELQGVIAHEFSHILNGDMRLNLRLIGILNGILVMALMGYTLLRTLQYIRISRSDRKNDGLPLVVILLLAGGAMVVIGYVGLFFGRLIQAAVSRQREYLADASAVQFTRNPSGLAGALKKIGTAGSHVNNAHAIETAHLFFASGIKIGLTSLLATHPPLIDRIKAIDPMFDGRFEIGPGATQVLDDAKAPMKARVLAGMLSAAGESTAGLTARQVIQRAGALTPHSVQRASTIIQSIPEAIDRLAREPFGARVVAIALLLSDDRSVYDKQLQALRVTLDGATIDEAVRLVAQVQPLDRMTRTALLDLIQPAMRQMSANQLRQFAAAVQALIEADGKVTLFEYAMYRQLRRSLSTADQSQRPAPMRYMSIEPLMGEIVTVLSALAYRGKDPAAGAESFRAGLSQLGASDQVLAANDYSLGVLDPALNRLAEASPGVKRRIIDAAAHAISSDGVIDPDEAEILRALCAALDVPVPPMG